MEEEKEIKITNSLCFPEAFLNYFNSSYDLAGYVRTSQVHLEQNGNNNKSNFRTWSM